MKRWIWCFFLIAMAVTAQQQSNVPPPPDCSLGYCSGLGVPTFACNAAQRYAQIDNPGTNYTCSGMPPHWVKDAGGSSVALPNGIVYGQGSSNARPSTSSDVVGLWNGCSGSNPVLSYTGSCIAAGGDASLPQGIPATVAAGQTPFTALPLTQPFYTPQPGTHANGPAVGFLNANGIASGAGTTDLAAFDANHNMVDLPEIQVQTDTTGATTIVCQEDLSKGIFDARCPKYGSGGIYGSNSGQALQDLRNAVICYQSETGKHASISLPPGQFHVGTPTQPTLTWPAGSYLTGVPNGEGASTFLLATYNNYNVFQVNTGQTAVCSDGQTHTNPLTNGSTKYLAAYGCGSGGCVNLPGDNGSYPSGGPNQGGMFIGDSQGDEEHLGAFNNGGYGITADGQDSHFAYLFTQLNNEWLLYGKDQAGQTYDPTTDGVHGDVVSTGVDNQVDHVEAYGTFGTPGREYGHLALFVWAGGNTQVSDLFLQVGQIGLYRSFANGGFGRLVNSRFDFMHGESIVSAGGNDVYSNLAIDGYCDNQAVITALGGHCDGIELGGGGNTLNNLIMGKNNGQFQTSVATGDVFSIVNSNNFGVGTHALTFENPGNQYRSLGAFNKPFNPSPNQSTGDNPDVSVNNVLAPVDTTPNTIHGVNPNAFVDQHVYVMMGNCNVTLAGPLNGGHWHGNNNADISLCASNPVNGPYGPYAGFLDFLVVGGTIYGDPPEMIEQSDPPNRIVGHFGYGGNTAPSRNMQGTVDSFGTGIFRQQPPLPAITLNANGPGTAYTYCSAIVVHGFGGILSTTHQCQPEPPYASTFSQFTYMLTEAIPNGWQQIDTYFDTTDPSMTSLNGLVDHQVAIGDAGLGYVYTHTVHTNDTIVNTSTIPVPYGIDTTGGLAIQRNVPTTSTEACQEGELAFGASPSSVSPATTGIYRCHPANTWTYSTLPATSTTW